MSQSEARVATLPPREYWLIERGDRIDTQIDSRGIVDIPKTVAEVKALIHPSYSWHPMLDVHHFEWPACNFPDRRERGRPNPAAFRDLPPLKGLLPREFQIFLHEVTRHPDPVEEEVMNQYIEAWQLADALFKKTREVRLWEKRKRKRAANVAANPHLVAEGFDGQDVIGEEIMERILDRHFRGVDIFRERALEIPAEFRFFDPEASLSAIAGQIGHIAAPRHLKLVKAIAT